MVDWFHSFFSGTWLDLQRSMWRAEDSARHASAVERMLALPPGARVLDVPCGNGRIAIELARRGHAVTGIDFTRVFLEEARATAGALPATFLERDMRALDGLEGFDAAFNYWGSFGTSMTPATRASPPASAARWCRVDGF